MAVKKCSKCGEEKPLSEFYQQSDCKDGLRPSCRTCVIFFMKARALANREKIRTYWQSYYQANKQKIIRRNASWARANPDRVLSYNHKNKSRARANGGEHSTEEIYALYKKQNGRCAYCRIRLSERYHRDHIVPSKLGGTNDITNIQLLCPPCNLSKGAKRPEEYAQRLGLLL